MRTKITYERVYKCALELFGYDKDKTNSWWMSKQECLNNLSPYEFVKAGYGAKLLKQLTRCIA